MPGTYAHDSAVTKLHDAVAISSATTTTGTGVNVGRPGSVRVKQSTGALTGASSTFATEIQGSDTLGSGYVPLGSFATLTESDDSETHYIDVYCPYTYMRAVTVSVGASSPTGAFTVTVEEPNYKRTKTDTA